jgi:hypothetical protein
MDFCCVKVSTYGEDIVEGVVSFARFFNRETAGEDFEDSLSVVRDPRSELVRGELLNFKGRRVYFDGFLEGVEGEDELLELLVEDLLGLSLMNKMLISKRALRSFM